MIASWDTGRRSGQMTSSCILLGGPGGVFRGPEGLTVEAPAMLARRLPLAASLAGASRSVLSITRTRMYSVRLLPQKPLLQVAAGTWAVGPCHGGVGGGSGMNSDTSDSSPGCSIDDCLLFLYVLVLLADTYGQ